MPGLLSSLFSSPKKNHNNRKDGPNKGPRGRRLLPKNNEALAFYLNGNVTPGRTVRFAANTRTLPTDTRGFSLSQQVEAAKQFDEHMISLLNAGQKLPYRMFVKADKMRLDAGETTPWVDLYDRME